MAGDITNAVNKASEAVANLINILCSKIMTLES